MSGQGGKSLNGGLDMASLSKEIFLSHGLLGSSSLSLGNWQLSMVIRHHIPYLPPVSAEEVFQNRDCFHRRAKGTAPGRISKTRTPPTRGRALVSGS